MYGGGTINGNGQAWYDAADHTAPTVIRFALTNSKVSHFNIVNSPRAHMGVSSSKTPNSLLVMIVLLSTVVLPTSP
ncbi:hypothetical protein G6F37_014201 [Rhizopus arrhizus]|nr:hypothetical protein G6F38_014080 [Rhizopus arrhizus]KAG1127051.1 hypothetical protein G6F37_014201 [Rhizopus arrhizus]